jgi:hypothetical protein
VLCTTLLHESRDPTWRSAGLRAATAIANAATRVGIAIPAGALDARGSDAEGIEDRAGVNGGAVDCARLRLRFGDCLALDHGPFLLLRAATAVGNANASIRIPTETWALNTWTGEFLGVDNFGAGLALK